MKKRKDNREYTKREFKGLKRKLLSAFTMFLVATILMTSTSYAWFVLSVAPEVSGISTSIGANGSLEMALLTTETRADLSKIRTAVGESLAQRNPAANNTWGNLVDLSYSDYGLGNIVLMPSRLNIVQGADGYSVDTNLISVPSYGYDGRIVELNDETMSATYSNNEFTLVVGSQDYGVRAIGTTDALSVQASALALAKANIRTYTNNAKSSTNAILSSHGDTLFNIVLTHSMDSSSTYGETELDALKAMLNNLNDVADYIDRALRQGIIAFAASEIAGKTEFTEVRDRVMGASSLEAVLGDLEEVGEIPAEFATWTSALSEMRNDINAANNAANALSGGTYTWDQFRDILDYVMNVDSVYINDTIFSQFDKNSASELLGGTVTLTLAPGSGIFADIADFTGNYSSVMTYVGTNIEIKTASTENPPYLDALNAEVKDLEAANGESGDAEPVALNATYGYAIDLAFRCNANTSDLLLQTTAEHRIYDGTESGSAMGSGSYMEFSTSDNSFALDKIIQLMDAVRVTFIDDKNAILGIAKLNTSNRSIVDGKVKASLYLYEYSLSEEDGSIIMGERRNTDNTITSLEQNVAKAITAIVWLDGDIVDNTMVSATESASLTGVLNLQFSSSANLVPANNGELLNITADKTALEEGLAGYEEKIVAGQGTYTTVSWENFVSAYNYAVAVNENPNANDNQVYFAAYELAKADTELENVSTEALETKIDEVREIMGTSENIARYVIKNNDGSYSIIGNEEHTQETHDGWNIVDEIYQVDYSNNLHDEGNELYTQIYTDESWLSLASALYSAESAVLNPKHTDAELNSALTALETAQKSLQRKVFYTPYEYNGKLYYEAICNANDADTYGKWYDSDFKRIVADITILNLDAYAEPVEIFEMEQDEYELWNRSELTPYINVLDEVYPELRDEEIAGMHWNVSDSEYYTELMNQRHINTINQYIGIAEDENLDVDTTNAKNLLSRNEKVSAKEARTVITALRDSVTAALDEKLAKAEEQNPAMTSSQRILLNTAVTNAKAVEGYNDASNTDLDNLRSAVQAVETLLAMENATKDMASTALAGINTELKNAEAKEVSEYNTLTHKLPIISEIYELVYSVDYPGMILGLSGKTGNITLNAVVLTENGIVGTVSKNVNIYTPFDHIAFSTNDWENTPHFNSEALVITEGNEKLVHIFAYYCISGEVGNAACRATEQKEIELGNIVNGVVQFPEEVREYVWASEDTDIATVSMNGDGTCTITAKKAGTARITVSVETVQGNTYTNYVTVTVTAP
ncbi:MAG: Ig-like domain-containing protein [Oscillospiraceae bacterium]|nr:Ig-like domain-containing protein [Oscillospiraceae bacterium]